VGQAEDYLKRVVADALTEDLGLAGDITSQAVFPEDKPGEAVIVAKQAGIVAGLFVAEAVFKALDPDVVFDARVQDGDAVAVDQVIARIKGNILSILSCERVALNFIAHMSGVATLTRDYVEIAAMYGVKVKDTRKTLPGLRPLEKYAVLVGGGDNHRFGLYDAVLIKDNHIAAAGSIKAAVELVRTNLEGEISIEVETETLAEVEEALAAGADTILLDNMDPSAIKAAIESINGAAVTEVSGGVNLDNLADKAAAGPDYISVGSLTQAAPAFDFSMIVEK
jgi:nicotinate-nucleotide pyrophosphorylase (carboxylating)